MTPEQNNSKQLQEELFKAMKAGDLIRMFELILQGADPFVKDENGMTAIQYAVLHKKQGEGNPLAAAIANMGLKFSKKALTDMGVKLSDKLVSELDLKFEEDEDDKL